MKEKHYSQFYDIMRFCTNTNALNIKIAGYIRNISLKESNMSKILDTEGMVHTLRLW
jgi:hypothetical protein